MEARDVPEVEFSQLPSFELLQEDGALHLNDGVLVFHEDHAFNSPSGAAGTVLGRSANGWREWANGQGRTLDELERQ